MNGRGRETCDIIKNRKKAGFFCSVAIGIWIYIVLEKITLQSVLDEFAHILNAKGAALKAAIIESVDAFQGKECDVVVFSLTRTHGTPGADSFLADSRRLNVALSRARDKLVIVGNKEYATKNALLRSIMEKCTISEGAIE